MRIVFVVPLADATGGVRTVATYARLLSRRGHEVVIVSAPRPPPSLEERVKSVLRGRGWPRPQPDGPSHVDDAGVEHRRLERYRPVEDGDLPDADVVVATWWRTAEWVAALSPRKGAKVHFVQGHDSDIPGQPAERVAASWRLPLHRIVCSRWLLGIARDLYGDSAASYVPNGVDLEQFSTPPRGRQARPTLGLLYSPDWIKGCDAAAAALRTVGRRFLDLRVVSFGSQTPSEAAPLPEGVEFTLLPGQDLIPRLYGSCDAWLWPSRREGFGLPILEAMACRTPVVAAPAGAAPDLLRDGGGVLLSSAEPGAMAEAAERILALPDQEWRAMSDQARAVAARHGWEESVRLFEAALELAVRGPARPAAGTTAGAT